MKSAVVQIFKTNLTPVTATVCRLRTRRINTRFASRGIFGDRTKTEQVMRFREEMTIQLKAPE